MEVVKVFKYLGMMMQSNNGCGKRIRYLKKTVRVGMEVVWGMGKDFGKEMYGLDGSCLGY